MSCLVTLVDEKAETGATEHRRVSGAAIGTPLGRPWASVQVDPSLAEASSFRPFIACAVTHQRQPERRKS